MSSNIDYNTKYLFNAVYQLVTLATGVSNQSGRMERLVSGRHWVHVAQAKS